MFTNEEIMRIAMQQSAWDNNCRPEDFLGRDNVVVPFVLSAKARRYYSNTVALNLVSYGGNLVASVKGEYRKIAEEYIGKFTYYHCFETPNMHWLEDRLKPLGQRVCFMAEYFLPDVEKLKRLECGYVLKVLYRDDLEVLSPDVWSNALTSGRPDLDVLGVGAYDGDLLIGLAACSADCADMWQIGVDVLPEYCRKGIASAMTSNLAVEILERGKVPFYCCAWSNIASVRNAIRSGLLPAWAEMTVKPAEYVEEINR